MAINFETVTGNQSSANVLAQINNNFAKINSNPVPKAEFATNADTVDNKHASELIPGAATFLDSITSLANLSIGRYFCTQTRQSWEPVTTTGSRTFLIEVSLNTPNNLKNYKINYIAGAGVGESYYSDYNGGSIKWNRVVNDKNIESFDSVKTTYDDKNRAGRVTTYDDMIVYKEGNSLINGDLIAVNDGTGNYYRVNVIFTLKRSWSESCSNYYEWNLAVKVEIYNSKFSLIKTVTSPNVLVSNCPTGVSGTGEIIGLYINQGTGDIIIGAAGRTSNGFSGYVPGYFYFSTASNTCFFINWNYANISGSSNSFSMTGPNYWYNNHFGILSNGVMHYIELKSNRSGVLTSSDTTITSGTSYFIGQKNNYVFMVVSGNSNPSLIRLDITTRSTQSGTVSGFNSSARCFGGEIDDNYIYFAIGDNSSCKVFKYNTSLSLISSSPVATGNFGYFMASKNYVAIFDYSGNLPTRVFSKSNLNTSSSYNKKLYIGGRYNSGIDRKYWFNQAKYNYNIQGIPIGEDYILCSDTVSFYNGDQVYNSPWYSSLYPIINIANGVVIGYFANSILITPFNETVPCYLDGIGLIFKQKYLDTSKIEYLLKSFRRN